MPRKSNPAPAAASAVKTSVWGLKERSRLLPALVAPPVVVKRRNWPEKGSVQPARPCVAAEVPAAIAPLAAQVAVRLPCEGGRAHAPLGCSTMRFMPLAVLLQVGGRAWRVRAGGGRARLTHGAGPNIPSHDPAQAKPRPTARPPAPEPDRRRVLHHKGRNGRGREQGRRGHRRWQRGREGQAGKGAGGARCARSPEFASGIEVEAARAKRSGRDECRRTARGGHVVHSNGRSQPRLIPCMAYDRCKVCSRGIAHVKTRVDARIVDARNDVCTGSNDSTARIDPATWEHDSRARHTQGNCPIQRSCARHSAGRGASARHIDSGKNFMNVRVERDEADGSGGNTKSCARANTHYDDARTLEAGCRSL